MIDKYYTPEMSEYHIGFECEVMDNSIFEKICFPEALWKLQELQQFQDPLMKMSHAVVRVKYLDREDIESFGFKLTSNFETHYNLVEYFELIVNSSPYDNIHIQLITPKENKPYHNVFIYTIEVANKEHNIFSGTIKNKSEFKVLLEQLMILTP